jgi:hypothetical protein
MTSRGLLILQSLIKEAQLLLGVFSDAVNKCGSFLFTVFHCNSLQLFYRVSGPSKFSENSGEVNGDEVVLS